MHCEPVKRNNGADDYCMKEETRIDGPWEFGTRPIRRASKTDWNFIWTCAKKGDLDKVEVSIRIRHYGNLVRIQKDHLTGTDHTDLRGIWIYGEAGIGKSRCARHHYPNHYPKLLNKWWDGYRPADHKYVVMDDLDPDHSKFLTYHLKMWADRYWCTLEVKGGAVASAYDKFIVTSQYSIDECFPDPKDAAAIKRRFKVTHLVFPWDPNSY